MQRPVPDETIVKRALRVREATESEMQKFIREEHSAMMGAARIGMDAARKLWPIETDHLHKYVGSVPGAISRAHELFEQAYEELDRISSQMHGQLVHMALMGELEQETLAQHEDSAKVGPKHEAQEAPAIERA